MNKISNEEYITYLKELKTSLTKNIKSIDKIISKYETIQDDNKKSIRDLKWEKYYKLLEKYYQEHGNINVPRNYQIDGLNLGFWLNRVLQAYKGNGKSKLTIDERIKLEKLGIKEVKNYNSLSWDDNYKLLEKYYIIHKNIDVPIDYEIDGIKLGAWLNRQRNNYLGKTKFKLTDDQIEKLNKLGIRWSKVNNSIKWEYKYNLLLEYYKEYGNIDVPKFYKISGINLGRWVGIQRIAYKNNKISNEQIKLLNDINMDWEPKNTKYLNRRVIDNMNEYNNILLKRTNKILDDLQSENVNSIKSKNDQLEIVKTLTKRLWK